MKMIIIGFFAVFMVVGTAMAVDSVECIRNFKVPGGSVCEFEPRRGVICYIFKGASGGAPSISCVKKF